MNDTHSVAVIRWLKVVALEAAGMLLLLAAILAVIVWRVA
jgi:hypothetical protein